MLKILFFLTSAISIDFYVLSNWNMYGALFLSLFIMTFYEAKRLYYPSFLVILVITGIMNDILNGFYLGSSSLVFILLILNNIYFANSNMRDNFIWQVLAFTIGYIDYVFITLLQCYGINCISNIDKIFNCFPALIMGCMILIWTKHYHPSILEFEDNNGGIE